MDDNSQIMSRGGKVEATYKWTSISNDHGMKHIIEVFLSTDCYQVFHIYVNLSTTPAVCILVIRGSRQLWDTLQIHTRADTIVDGWQTSSVSYASLLKCVINTGSNLIARHCMRHLTYTL